MPLPTSTDTGNPAGGPVRPDDEERADLLETLSKQRGFLRFTVRGLDDEQAARRTTVSRLCLAGLIKHVSLVEERWANFIEHGPTAMGGGADPAAIEAHAQTFTMQEGETLEGLLDRYQQTSERTDELVRTLPSLDASQPLPEAPWFPRDTRWTARRVLLHMIAETSQHAGHADIIREALDGQRTMG
jgi:uncharacterized damage-inducible protein DinB